MCINQADSADKSRQIPLMSQIYSSALRVLVWLGDSRQAENELRAFTRLPRLLRQASDQVARIRQRGGKLKEDPEEDEAVQLLTAIVDVVRAMFD